jgi:hypothetical protein
MILEGDGQIRQTAETAEGSRRAANWTQTSANRFQVDEGIVNDRREPIQLRQLHLRARLDDSALQVPVQWRNTSISKEAGHSAEAGSTAKREMAYARIARKGTAPRKTSVSCQLIRMIMTSPTTIWKGGDVRSSDSRNLRPKLDWLP